ncbi:MAG: diacylglycerol kinase family protein [Clostridia bacterium]|nr:diacylglycerol kinase family protein [Clostridia bacterium]
MKTYAIFNPYANNKTGEESAKKLNEILAGEDITYVDITSISDYKAFFADKTDDKVIVCGGDGTLNRFVNDTKDVDVHNIYLFAAGNGNDFLNDVAPGVTEPVLIDEYIKNLPTVYVNGEERLFINGIGYGIDGYCCEVADEIKKTSDKPINYTSIAIKGLLGKFKTRNAKITVDGVTHEFKNAWLAPAMNGRFYGGGMMIAPMQDRKHNENLSVVCLYCKSKLKTLMVFPSIFKGEHIKHKEMISIFSGKEITVEFDKPTALQIDGETVLGVMKYEARSYVCAKDKAEV